MPIDTADNPFSNDFTIPENPPATQTNQVVAKLGGFREVSFEIDFDAEFNLTLNHQVRAAKIEQFFLWELRIFTYGRKQI